MLPLNVAFDSDTAKMLINNGADVNKHNSKGFTPLAYVFNNYDDDESMAELAKTLVASGAGVNTLCNTNTNPPTYMYAVWFGRYGSFDTIFQNGASVFNVYRPNEFKKSGALSFLKTYPKGWTALLYAVDKNDIRLAKALLKYADANSKEFKEHTNYVKDYAKSKEMKNLILGHK